MEKDGHFQPHAWKTDKETALTQFQLQQIFSENPLTLVERDLDVCEQIKCFY